VGRPAGVRPTDPDLQGRLRVHLPIPRRDWYELALDEADRDTVIATQWADLRRTAPDLDRPEVAEAFRATLDTLARHYASRGSLIAAVEWYPRTGRPPQTVLDLTLVESLPADSPYDEAAGLYGLLMLPTDDDLGPRRIDRVELAAGPAVRLRLLAPGGQDAAGRDMVCDIVQYWVPTDTGATVLVSCSTSAVADGDRNADLLDRLMPELVVSRLPR
jgi:hypothetical protein